MEFLKEFFSALYPEHHYVNIKSPLLLTNINYILAGLYIGIVIAAAAICFRKSYMGRAIRAMLNCGAFSSDSAKSADELGLAKKLFIKRALRKGSFGSLVIAVPGGDSDGERYYIPEERRFEADERYSRKGIGVGAVIVWAIVLIPVFMVIRFVIPELLQMLDNYITSIKK